MLLKRVYALNCIKLGENVFVLVNSRFNFKGCHDLVVFETLNFITFFILKPLSIGILFFNFRQTCYYTTVNTAS